MLSVDTVLGLIGLIILVGLGGEVFFKKTGVPSVLFLIGLGVLIGPAFGLVEVSRVVAVAPYFGTLALLIILFDGGLNLSLARVLREGLVAVLYTLVVFVATVAVGATLFVLVGGGSWLNGLMLGAIVGGTTGAIVIPTVSNLTWIRERVKVLVSLESAFTDVFVVVATLSLIGIASPAQPPNGALSSIVHAFVDALLLAVLAGVLWARLLAWLQGQALLYMLTLSAVFLLYVLAEQVGANGAITILLFGLVLGNMHTILASLPCHIRRVVVGSRLTESAFSLDEVVRRLNEELSFLVRTFFYVLLGLLFDFKTSDWREVMIGMGLFAAVLGVRWGATEGIGRATGSWTAAERRLITAMLPRGVACAVMAFLPAQAGVPDTEVFPRYALTVLALSIAYMTVALVVERRRAERTVVGDEQVSGST